MTNSLFDVSGQVALVTGAASGLGWAIAEAMAEHGARVSLADVDAAALERGLGQLKAKGHSVEGIVLDVGDRPAVLAAVERCAARQGRLDAVFANAGISAGPSYQLAAEGEIDHTDMALWDRSLQINLHGTFDTMRAAATPMKRQRHGRIIVTASISGMSASPVSGYGYVAAKAALVNLVRHAAVELGPFNVCVNAIAPGFFVTNLAGGRLKHDAATAERLAAQVPLRRLAYPDDIKGLALFLASPGSGYITGTVIPIDGGVSAG